MLLTNKYKLISLMILLINPGIKSSRCALELPVLRTPVQLFYIKEQMSVQSPCVTVQTKRWCSQNVKQLHPQRSWDKHKLTLYGLKMCGLTLYIITHHFKLSLSARQVFLYSDKPFSVHVSSLLPVFKSFLTLSFLFVFVCVRSLRAELCLPPAAPLWWGLSQQSPLRRRGLLLLSDWIQAAGLRCADVPQRYHPLLEWQGTPLWGWVRHERVTAKHM